MKLVHLVGLITKIFVTMHGHMNVKENLIVRFPKMFSIREVICLLKALLSYCCKKEHTLRSGD